MRMISMLGIAVAAAIATPGFAATIINPAPAGGSVLTVGSVAAGNVFTNNSAFSSDNIAYLLNEGTFGGVQSFLLHYDKDTTGALSGVVSGSFDVLLGAGETFSFLATSLADLLATDPANGATYQTLAGAHATIYRGLESDDFVHYTQSGNKVSVSYKLVNGDPNALDDARIGITTAAVPEPAAWAMMLSGFALVGGALRLGRKGRARAAA